MLISYSLMSIFTLSHSLLICKIVFERDMARAGQWISARSINTMANANPQPNSLNIVSTRAAKSDAPKRNDIPLISKRGGQKSSRRLVTVSTADGKWQGDWNLDYVFSLQQLHLQDLSEDDDTHQHNTQNSQVFLKLSIHKHAGFGLSVDGRITTSLTRKCSNCSSPYCREIDTSFNVWVLPLTKNKDSENELPEIGGDDPSVIYVKPGFEADLDSLVQDTIRLATSVKETCSESCEKSEPKLQYIGTRNVASIDRRWSRLLELRNANR